jgi:hypothetical protein
MFCPECGYENPDGAKFCIGCRYQYSTPTKTVAMWKCQTCGQSVEADFEICWNCQSYKSANAQSVLEPADNLRQSKPVSPLVAQRRSSSRLALFGLVVMLMSAVAFFWGSAYTGNLGNLAHSAFAEVAGEPDSVFAVARACQTLGVVGFVAGLVLFFVGLAQRATAA